jgi:serine/threonine protein kinase
MKTNSDMKPTDKSEAAIFDAALACVTLQERAVYLDKACVGQPGLRQRIEALLAAHEQASKFLEPQAAAARPTVRLALPPEEQPGERIGRYKLLQKIGEGGCGVVYMAEQEEPVRRRVALKVIKLGMDTKQVVARFEAERQALALMDHPNIAKVLDAGATEAGRPFFVMELVKGIPATRYADENKLDTRQRLDLFIQICQAVQHAHQKGIIHRDIKPSNVLVADHDGTPVPKVIDFGIAKATTDQRLTDKTLFTALEQFIGTPAYMSPEQAKLSGLDVDTRSDIYSLGVLLYELLTGKTPFDARRLLDAGFDEIRRIIREEEPPKPSTRLTQELVAADVSPLQSRGRNSGNVRADSRRLLQEVEGDLDWIVMKCLEKDRTRRYETANGLAADVQRHLSNEPVVACPPSVTYRFQKMVRRNKAAFAITTTVVGLVVIGLSISTWLMHKQKVALERALVAEQAQKRSDQEKELAETMNHVLWWWPSIVEMGVSHDNPEALAQLESNLRKVVTMSRQLNARTNATYLDALQKLTVLLKDRQASSENSETRAEILSLDREAEAYLKDDLANRKRLDDESLDTAQTMEALADYVAGTPEELDLRRNALNIRKKIQPGETWNAPWTICSEMETFAQVLRKQNQLAEAEQTYRELIKRWKPAYLAAQKTNNVGLAGNLKNDLTEILIERGNLTEAETLCHEAVTKAVEFASGKKITPTDEYYSSNVPSRVKATLERLIRACEAASTDEQVARCKKNLKQLVEHYPELNKPSERV